jgi:hypothetical protein
MPLRAAGPNGVENVTQFTGDYSGLMKNEPYSEIILVTNDGRRFQPTPNCMLAAHSAVLAVMLTTDTVEKTRRKSR